MKRWKCTVCGEIFEGEFPPVPCPVCSAGEGAFEELPEQGDIVWRCTVCGQVFEGAKPPVPCPVCGAGESAFLAETKKETAFRLDTEDRFVLVGGGVASFEAAKAIRARNQMASITLICGEGVIPYNRPALSDVVGDGLSFESIILAEYPFYEENRITLVCDAKVQAIDTAEKSVLLSNGKALGYTKLLLATGANPFVPVTQGENAVPLYTLRSFADADFLLNHAKNKRALIVGGGILGVEAALALRERGCTVCIVELSPRLMMLQADEYASKVLHERLTAVGISVHTGISIATTDASGALLTDGTHVNADFILASVGVRSEIALAQKAGLSVNRGIIIDAHMRTSDANIYAAGDCAEFAGRVTGLYAAAAQGGQNAGAQMAGEEVEYLPAAPATAFEGAGVSLFSTGVLMPNEQGNTLVYENKYTGVYKKLVFQSGKLAGGILLGDVSAGAKLNCAVNAAIPYKKALELL